MALFQSSVIKKELQLLNQAVIDEKWNEFFSHFGNLEIQQKIRGLKEEQYQGEFLDDLFVKVLGYTKPPKPNHNLVTEQKNETNSKKADGAIIVDEKVIGVIELKGTNTTDLEKVKEQAFLYKVSHPECIYVITSNFEKLRFYIENTVDFIEFNLFQLSKKEFSLLYICLSYENIKNNVPKHLKDESVSKENQITKQLYKDYSDFKRALYNNLVALNPQYDKLLLFKKTQKLLDRFLFIFFAEDRQLVPTNLIRRINLEWEDIVKVKRINVSLYERYKRYFDDLNSGAKVTLPAFGKKTGDAITAQFEIFAYNGGLFAPDDVLDKVSIDDDLLHKHSLLLSDYDFESDVDVNILGHIFENSLNEIDEIKSEIEGATIDKTKTRRKKDGVFYTPKYITKYIVDNTVGKLCTEKKAELKLVDEDYTNDQKIQAKTKKAHLDKLTDYRAWLLQLTICDPACGSGAFLNQALEFLIAEHRYVDELQAKLMGDSMILSDVETSILENNIYGVDLNDESVEIAKLSLWLRTAQKGRKLNSLNNNIKCGNSLIDDPEVAGDKAFSWEKEFPHVFEKGGFDIIIGNPPYVSNWTLSDNDKEMVSWLSEKYKNDLTGHWDLFVCFISISLKYLKNFGYNSFILPTSFLKEKYGKLMRESVISNYELIEIVDFGEKVIFENVARQTFIYNIRKAKNKEFISNIKLGIDDDGVQIPQSFFGTLKNTSFKTNVSAKDISIYKSLNTNSYKLGELVCINVGVVAHSKSGSPIFFKKDDVIYNEYKEGFKKYIIGSNISRYSVIFDNQYMDYENNAEYFHRPKFKLLFESEKIIVRRTSGNNNSIIAYFDDQCLYTNDSMTHLIRWNNKVLEFQKPDNKWKINLDDKYDLKFILAIISSKLITYYFSKFLSTDTLQGAYSSIYPEDIRDLPIIKTSSENQQYFSSLSQKMLQLNTEFKMVNQKFISFSLRNEKKLKLTSKLEKWYELDFPDFIKELNKVIKTAKGTPPTKKDEFEWMELFEENKKKALELKTQIDQTDKEIDRMVYELYGLTEEEILIVEHS